jgi:hypothetical protein
MSNDDLPYPLVQYEDTITIEQDRKKVKLNPMHVEAVRAAMQEKLDDRYFKILTSTGQT